MKKKKAVVLLTTIAVLIGAGRAFASYYEGDEYYAIRTSDGLVAGGSGKCQIRKGEVAKVLVPLTRYNLLVVATSSGGFIKCVSVVSQT
jgi:hypothetical protein